MNKWINVLSLFDWMSCWMIALERTWIKVDNYFASEIDKYAIQVSGKNYPQIYQVWDVTELRANKFNELCWGIDILIWWSPCQWFSFAGKQLNFEDPRSKLFFEYVRILKETKPKYFLLENVRMKKEYQDIISRHLWVQPIIINSSLVCAQNRVRLYWVWERQEDGTYKQVEISQPEDKGILLKDILEDEVDEKYYLSEEVYEKLKKYESNARISPLEWKSYCLNTMQWWHRQPKILQTPRGNNKWGIKAKDWKTPCLSSNSWEHNNRLVNSGKIRKLTPIECERLQTVSDNYTDCVSNSQRYKMLWNWWTIDVISHIFKQLKQDE